MKAAIYLRVSTNEQTTENQRIILEEAARRSGWTIVETYEDQGISGSKGRDSRPAFNRLCHDATRRKFDVIMAWSVDRLGRSLQDLVGFLSELHATNTGLFLHQQGVDTTTPAGMAMFQMMGVFAEFERSMIQDRVKAGLERARAAGVKLGRPTISEDIQDKVLAARREGISLRKIAGQVGVSLGTVHGIVKSAACQN